MGYERATIVPRKLLGFISLRELILAPKNALLRDLMDEELITLKYTDDRELAAQIMARYDFLAVPVLDDQGAMLGIVTHDDVLDVVTQEATEDMQRQAGMTPLSESYLTARFSKLWRSRAQWLAVLFIAELGTFTVLEFFEGMIASVVVLTLFIPLVISTGGNTGSQASTLVTRAIALGEVKLSDWKRLLRREMLMGLALGVSLGLIAFVRGAATPDDTRGGPREQKYDLQAVFPLNAKIERDERGDYIVPKSTPMIAESDKEFRIRLPEHAHEPALRQEGGNAIYTFQAGSQMRTDPVDRWKLGWVIGLAVLFICMWGTMIGASLPLVFKRIGLDPAVASGPFVATFVDITGIAIFCSLAKWLLM